MVAFILSQAGGMILTDCIGCKPQPHINSCGWETRFLAALLPRAVVQTPKEGGVAVGNALYTSKQQYCQPVHAVVCGEDVNYCNKLRHRGVQVWGAPDFSFALVVFYNRGYDRGMPAAVPPTVWGVAYAQRNCVPHREAAAGALSKHVDVFAYGTCRGVGNRIQRRRFLGAFPQLASHPKSPYRTHAFALTMEHTNERGYCTEKAIVAAAAGAIPIYDGDSASLCQLLNCNRVIFWNDSTPLVVAALLADRDRYAKMWKLPRVNTAGGAQRALLAARRTVGI